MEILDEDKIILEEMIWDLIDLNTCSNILEKIKKKLDNIKKDKLNKLKGKLKKITNEKQN